MGLGDAGVPRSPVDLAIWIPGVMRPINDVVTAATQPQSGSTPAIDNDVVAKSVCLLRAIVGLVPTGQIRIVSCHRHSTDKRIVVDKLPRVRVIPLVQVRPCGVDANIPGI